jgi:hypothetical protein
MSNSIFESLKASFVNTGYTEEQAAKIVEAMFPESQTQKEYS